MSELNPPPGSVFAAAPKITTITVELTVSDVQSLKPGLSAEAARQFIEHHCFTIAGAMLCHGLSSIAQLLQEENDAN